MRWKYSPAISFHEPNPPLITFVFKHAHTCIFLKVLNYAFFYLPPLFRELLFASSFSFFTSPSFLVFVIFIPKDNVFICLIVLFETFQFGNERPCVLITNQGLVSFSSFFLYILQLTCSIITSKPSLELNKIDH